MGRYSDINRAEELLAAKNKLEAWRKLDGPAKKAAYKTSRLGLRTNIGRQVGYIKPFGTSANFWYETKVLAPPDDPATPNEENETSLITTLVSAIIGATGKRVLTATPTGANLIIKKAKKIEFAKVRVQASSGNSREATSRFTGNKYRQQEVKSVSCSFGMIGDENEQTAREAIRAALKTALPTAIISFTPQGFVG
ncbi:MAG: hypothetical protein JGK17_31645 [Microcoleus sp. PH2017_10_PVI_O_A]|uniref:hypothetical protein n=1 Tax=unclassified Microcoleus TaxID=2642155 RepID=UPI001DA1D0D4|nr:MULTISPECIES: hypothetical protein [unclassified Microcoleus]MCC3410011.1 hypothetical protein [Microcoleus sp. PH2017_10_PVI_O_A]MCC3464307.1 hypothetical protein [Microcoleus sp. PH2017_11_PCY_U_A]MCC3482620.1 hypothetical protein [Microcoleus sp. PH2017_12_PCY_D_A]MCC3532502.1 hypothetical protein [Microcoleus sp. PH2017_21_RUC_O_A]MCC3544768.1 hypothetical protein [Microcoleus sp. PH2017_22_RUC_O_B]